MNYKLLFLSFSIFFALPVTYAAPGMDISSQISDQITNQTSRTISAGISKNLFDNLIIPELKIRNSSGAVKQMQVSADKHFLSLLLADGTARVWDLDLGIQRPMIMGNQASRIAIDAQQQIIFAANATGIESYDVLTAQHQAALPIAISLVNDIAVSAKDGLLLISSANPSLSLWDSHSNKMKWQKSDFTSTPNTITLAANHRYAAIVCRDKVTGKDVLEIRDFSLGNKLQTFTNNSEKIIFSQFNPDATTIEVGYGNGDSIVWNIQTGEQLSTKKLTSPIIAMDKANKVYAYLLENGSALVTNSLGDKLASIAKENNSIQAITLLAKGKKLMTAMENGQIFLWNVEDGKELLQLISTKQGWTVVDSSGRFDSSELGMPNVSWQAGDQEIPFDNIATQYYEPGLFASALNDENYLNAKPPAIQQGITLPPKLDVSVNNTRSAGDDVELTIDVYDQGGGIGSVNLYHNEKIVNVQRAIISDKTVQEQDKERRTLIVKIKPTAGKNEVMAIASNKMGIENQSNATLFTADVSAKAPLLRVATIGINRYSDKNLNLDYSVADAQSIEQLLTQKKFAKLTTNNKKQLYNQNASKAAILSVLRELSQGEQQDVLAIYFAGHGISVNGEWYFLPYETALRSDLNYFASVGISATEISDIFKNSNIQNILLMIDSCYSGASLDSFKNLQNSQRKFSRTISRSVGITIVTATRKNQKAAELSDLGHGLFTYVLGKGMGGEADFKPQDNQISAHELADFSTRTIPNFSKRYIGSAQEPTAFTMGQDFILFNRK